MAHDLHEYHSRRDFSRTSEPHGGQTPKRRPRAKAKTNQHSYVIQKHAARRLHYDFRLELDGVLLSWAVPKGPSLDPRVKRLAVEVEPHPVEYGSFEGEIAEGQYGAGSVMVWDTGTWEPLDDDPRVAFEKGHLTFALHGDKLRGAWHLVRTARGRAQASWLLFKANDEYADPDTDILTSAPDSVVSGLSIDELTERRSNGKRAAAAKPAAPTDEVTAHEPSGKATAKPASPLRRSLLDEVKTHPAARRVALPSHVDVQLATLVQAPPLGEAWLHEIKFDGYRVVVRVNDGAVQLLTRRSLDWTERMPVLAAAVSALDLPDVIVDGEFVALDDRGVSNFQMLQNSLSANDADNLVYYAFDLLHYDGLDVRALPLVERKALLKQLLVPRLMASPELASRIRLSEHVRGSGAEFFEQASKLGLEGIVSKRADAPHVGARSKDWLKAKCSKRQEFVIIGYTEPAGSRSHLGALLVAVYDGDSLVYCGRVGTGFTQESLAELAVKLKPLSAERPALNNAPKGAHARGVHWVTPTLVAEVAHMGFTEDGILRHPAFQGLREDKAAKDVRRELEIRLDDTRVDPAVENGENGAGKPKAQVTPAPARGASLTQAEPQSVPQADTSRVKLTNPNKVLYPSVGVTKRELLDYAALVADRLLPHVINRPLTLVRCPNGEGKQCFFQKHPGVSAPGLRAVDIREKEGKADYAVIDDADGLFALAQLGVLEIHTSGAHASDFDHPDLLVFDLDPDPSVGFSEVIRCAQRLREIFDGASLESFVKTTGGKGLHVCIPIEPGLTWPQAKAFTQHVAAALAKDEPQRYVVTQSKAQRVGKIFIDYLRNGRGATFVAPYSTRARPTAPVATPLFWEELTPDLRPDQFTVRNLAQRLWELSSDPFERMANLRQKLPIELARG